MRVTKVTLKKLPKNNIKLEDYYINLLGETLSVYYKDNKIYCMATLDREYKEFSFDTMEDFTKFQDYNGFTLMFPFVK